ncbi:MAG: hypothetical protein ACRCZD_19835 [Phycicoccus sp.]
MALDAFAVRLDSPEAIRVAAAGLVGSFQAVVDRAQDVRTTWLALPQFYRAPEQEVLLAAMNTPAERADTLLGQARTVGDALEVYADALADLHAQQAVLATDIAGFYQDRADTEAENADNTVLEDIADALNGEQEKLAHRENQLMDRIHWLQAAKDEAERNCANAIGALWGAEPFEASDRTTVGDTSVYGMSADGYAAVTRAGDAPWGRPDAWDSDNWLVRANMFFTGAGESITGTIGFLGDLTGQGDDGAAAAAWSGLGQLATDSLRFASLPLIVVSGLSDPDGSKESAQRLVAVGKSTIGWDTWDTSGWYTAGGVGLDVGLAAASLGAGGAVKGSVRGAAATRFTRLLDHAGEAGLDIRTAAAAARLRLNTTLNTRLTGLTTLSDDLAARLPVLHPATPDVPTSRTVLDDHVMRHEPDTPTTPPTRGGQDWPDLTNRGPDAPNHVTPEGRTPDSTPTQPDSLTTRTPNTDPGPRYGDQPGHDGTGGGDSAPARLTPHQTELINEVRKSGLRINESAVVRIGTDPNGHIVWLERGGTNPRSGRSAGLQHILEEHQSDFDRTGVKPSDIAELVHRAVTEGKYTGHLQGRPPGRPIYELYFQGRVHYVAVSVGDNGFIVGASPRSATNPFRGSTYIDPELIGNPGRRGWEHNDTP